MKKQKTPFEKLVAYCKENPLAGAFVVDAVCKLSDRLIHADAETQKVFARSLVTYECWTNAGKGCVDAMGIVQERRK